MIKHVIRRSFLAIPTLLIISVLTFLFIRIIPGDPAVAMAGMFATEKQVEAIRERMGLNKPLYLQYYIWLKRILTGDLGESIKNQYPIRRLLASKLPVTLTLTVGGMFIAIVLALSIGLAAATAKSRIVRSACTVLLGIAFAIPDFWLGILSILIFATAWQFLPPNGYVAFGTNPSKALLCFIMPWLVIGIKQGSAIGRYVQESYLQEARKDYVTVARAKGVKEAHVRLHHILRNAVIPVITVIGMQFGYVVTGAVIVETIFNLPGLGRLLLNSLFMRDYPVLQVLILFVGCIFVVLNLVVDITYGMLDPRITYD